MADKKIEPGPATRRIIANLIRFRESRNLTYTQIARDLEQIGRPIPILGLRRIEAGERRVDVDDIEALAQVFGVPPLLLLYSVGTNEAEVEILPDIRASPWDAAKWFTGEAELPPGHAHMQLSAAASVVTGGPGPAVQVLALHRRHDQFVDAWKEERPGAEREHIERGLIQLRREMSAWGVAAPPLPPDLRHIDPDQPVPPKPTRKGRTK